MDLARFDDVGSAPRQPHAAGPRQSPIQRSSERGRFYFAGNSTVIWPLLLTAVGRRRLECGLTAAMIFVVTTTCRAQEMKLPAGGTLIKASPIFWPWESTRRPIILLPAGTTVTVL